MDQTVRELRHDLRGSANCLILCCTALPHCEEDEQVEFLDEMIRATDKFIEILDTLHTMPEHFIEDAPQ